MTERAIVICDPLCDTICARIACGLLLFHFRVCMVHLAFGPLSQACRLAQRRLLGKERSGLRPHHVNTAVTTQEHVLAVPMDDARRGHVDNQRLAATRTLDRLVAHIRQATDTIGAIQGQFHGREPE